MSDHSCDCHEPTATISVRGINFYIDAKDLPKCECRPGGEVQIPEGSVLLKKLTADLDLFVAPGGDDANDGLSAATPLKTIAAALEKTLDYARSVYTITINLASGSYPEFVNVDFTGHYPKLVIKGNSSLPVIEDGVSARMHGYLTLDQVHVRQTTNKFIVWSYNKGSLHLINCKVTSSIGDDSTYAVACYFCGYIRISGTLSVTTAGTARYIFCASLNSFMLLDADAVITVSGAVSTATFVSAHGSRINAYAGVKISGSVTGRRYDVSSGALLSVLSGSSASIPGTVAGTVAAGSVYAIA